MHCHGNQSKKKGRFQKCASLCIPTLHLIPTAATTAMGDGSREMMTPRYVQDLRNRQVGITGSQTPYTERQEPWRGGGRRLIKGAKIHNRSDKARRSEDKAHAQKRS